MNRSQAQKWYGDFTGRKPLRTRRMRVPVARGVLAVMGNVREFHYVAVIEGEGAVNFVHKFKAGSAPLLATDGKSLFLIGGRYHVTRRGIVDLDRGGRERE